jgi:hexulose-6-phosphate isomerase
VNLIHAGQEAEKYISHLLEEGEDEMRSGRSRRDFLKASVAAGAAPWAALSYGPGAPPAISMLPKQLSYAERFKLAREVGFEAVEGQTVSDEREAQEIKKAADDAKVRIHSVMNMAHWDYPLSSGDPAVVEKSLDGMRTSLRNAKL